MLAVVIVATMEALTVTLVAVTMFAAWTLVVVGVFDPVVS
jgi:hypothetical protein